MTDKPQHEFGVSRETDTEAPSDVSRETDKKPSRKSAVYLYLLVLFGAAFLMLLLAYFIQQRNNAEAIDGLQDSWNLSREELVEEIAKLKEEKEQWQADTQASGAALREEREKRRQAEEAAGYNAQTAARYSSEKQAANTLAYLERFCAERDWLMAAVVVEDCDRLFNEKNKAFDPDNQANFVQAARYLELRETVFGNAGCMVTEGYSTAEDDSDYTEWVYIHPSTSRYKAEAVEAARRLWRIVDLYPSDPEASRLLAEFAAQPQWMEALNSRAFQPSTIALFEQVKTGLLDQGWLEEHEDGTLSPVFLYGGDDENTVNPTLAPTSFT